MQMDPKKKTNLHRLLVPFVYLPSKNLLLYLTPASLISYSRKRTVRSGYIPRCMDLRGDNNGKVMFV